MERLATLTEVVAGVSRAAEGYQQVLGQSRAIQARIEALEGRVAAAQGKAEVFRKAAAFLSAYGDEREAAVHGLIESLVSQGLVHVFQEDLRFVVVQKVSGSRTVVEFQIESVMGDTKIITPVMSARGGGVAAVSGFLLQVVVMLLTDAPKVLFLDETFAQVSAEYENRLADFISQLADNIGLQVVMVTHSDAYEAYADASWRTSITNGKTSFKKVL